MTRDSVVASRIKPQNASTSTVTDYGKTINASPGSKTTRIKSYPAKVPKVRECHKAQIEAK